jgi:hypothetical protein
MIGYKSGFYQHSTVARGASRNTYQGTTHMRSGVRFVPKVAELEARKLLSAQNLLPGHIRERGMASMYSQIDGNYTVADDIWSLKVTKGETIPTGPIKKGGGAIVVDPDGIVGYCSLSISNSSGSVLLVQQQGWLPTFPTTPNKRFTEHLTVLNATGRFTSLKGFTTPWTVSLYAQTGNKPGLFNFYSEPFSRIPRAHHR